MTERSQSAERRIGDLSSRVESLTTEADAARERAAAAEARAQEANSERQRALDREHQLTEEMTALRNLVEAKFAQLNK
jgi:outer membrane murein-binding lipoprotein Lpp